MTFRARLVLAATVAVIVAVLVASAAAYFAASNALINSVDDSLAATAQSALHGQALNNRDTPGLSAQVVDANGNTVLGGGLPVDSSVRNVANGSQRQYYADVTVQNEDLREVVVHLAPGTQVNGAGPFPEFLNPPGGALLLAEPLAGVNSQLRNLGIVLTVIAIVGILVAVLLGWLVARTALVPLDELTSSVEEVADTTDVSKRLDPGGPDELGRLRRAFNRMLAALERSRESQRQLVLDAAHELRTPLTSLRTNLEVAGRIEDLPPKDRAVLVADVLTQMDELTTLIGDLAELARGEHRPAEAEAFRLDELVADAVAVAATHGRPKGVQFELHASPCWVEGHRDGIARAVGNLLDNALKWSPEGASVEVRCVEGEITVRDHGPGIAPEDLPHVFDRFWRAPSARSLPGSGLGLAIVAQVARTDGGDVSAETAPGGGALVRLSFPTVTRHPSELGRPDEPAPPRLPTIEPSQAAPLPSRSSTEPPTTDPTQPQEPAEVATPGAEAVNGDATKAGSWPLPTSARPGYGPWGRGDPTEEG